MRRLKGERPGRCGARFACDIAPPAPESKAVPIARSRSIAL